MSRERFRFSQGVYDLLVLGGGIQGVWIAWDAVLRGLSVALVEKGDFGHATSSSSLRIIHGGLRYLQYGDLRRMRQSMYERMVLMHVAPYLVRPLPFLIPTYHYGLRSKWVLRLAMMVSELLGKGVERERVDGAGTALPPGRVISKDACRRLVPGVAEEGLTGGVVYSEAQVSNSERLLLSVLNSAMKKGADAANYLEGIRLLRRDDRIVGVTARDVLTGDELDLRGRVVVNVTGPWVDRVLDPANGSLACREHRLLKAFNLLVDRPPVSPYAVGLYSATPLKDPDTLLNRGGRLLFITPWQNHAFIGTAHLPYGDDPDTLEVTEEEIQAFIAEINGAYPPFCLTRREVRVVYGGLLPAAEPEASHPRLLKHYQIQDHHADHSLDGLISVRTTKYSEARHVAEKVVDLIFRKLGKVPPKSVTAVTPLRGGAIERLEAFVSQETQEPRTGLDPGAIRHLITQYGSAYTEVLKYVDERPHPGQVMDDTLSILKAEVRHGVKEEMAQRLADVVFRRTRLGLAGCPSDSTLSACADIMAEELGWSAERKQEEIREIRAFFPMRT